ncbi:hypothetical protein [Haloactinomyces albus]|uniref:Uncharacterized protein n=1 Tax=Haloactinomyces albus TaxID=1352928 RepID=A0AAE3ZHW3_9ACTN|nr:hypothetical protein [Haloactinomyces albus]MDR7304380.1 hypothetical protein [Haloactinomyces albus]
MSIAIPFTAVPAPIDAQAVARMRLMLDPAHEIRARDPAQWEVGDCSLLSLPGSGRVPPVQPGMIISRRRHRNCAFR